MTTDQYGEEIEFSSSVGRVISDGFFPTSPAATVREAIFSEILSGVLGVSPNNDFEDLRSEVVEHEAIERESAGKKVWDVFLKTYTTTGERGARGKEAKRYALPFHPQIARTLKPAETRNWDKWYRMLMTSGSPPSFNMDLHQRFVNRVGQMGPSNTFEQSNIQAGKSAEGD